MKFRQKFVILLFTLIFFSGMAMAACTGRKDGGKHCRKCATPEPGTYIDRKALLIVKNVNQFVKNPKKSLKLTSTLGNLLEPRVKLVTDTTIFQDSLSIPLRIYYPKAALRNKPAPMIFFIHGGAFMYGGIESYEMLMKKLSRESGCIVVSVEYRLAPEHPFPAGFNDCYAALIWLSLHATELGSDPAMISVMGDSAGGNLAAVTVLRSQQESGPRVASLALIYPSTTFADTLYPSRDYFSGHYSEPYLLSDQLMREVRESYLQPGADIQNPYVSPLFADFSGDFPPTLIITAQCDPLRDEGKLLADRMTEAGVQVTYHMYEGMIHAFLSFYTLLPEGKDALEELSSFVNNKE
ncbi:MAG: alpha/beta hydrolase [Bacteroidota bacterium]